MVTGVAYHRVSTQVRLLSLRSANRAKQREASPLLVITARKQGPSACLEADETLMRRTTLLVLVFVPSFLLGTSTCIPLWIPYDCGGFFLLLFLVRFRFAQ